MPQTCSVDVHAADQPHLRRVSSWHGARAVLRAVGVRQEERATSENGPGTAAPRAQAPPDWGGAANPLDPHKKPSQTAGNWSRRGVGHLDMLTDGKGTVDGHQIE